MSNSLKNRVNKGVLDLKPYEPGKPIEETEKEFFKSLMILKGNRTIILISHNKENLKYCDKVYNVKNGTILDDQYS